jgi:hypothetical protein
VPPAWGASGFIGTGDDRMDTERIPHARLLAAIRIYRDLLINADLAVDDAHDEQTLSVARRERARVALHLAHLIDLAPEETAGRYVEAVSYGLGVKMADVGATARV